MGQDYRHVNVKVENVSDNETDDDPVEMTIPVVIMPTKEGDTINRIQFPVKEATELQRCAVRLKQNVGHLQIEQFKGIPLLNEFFDSGPGPSSSLNTELSGPSNMYQGEGFSDHEVLDYSLGFFKDGNFCLMPVEKTFEMRRIIKKHQDTGQKLFDTEKSLTKPELAPVRMRFERHETDAQKKMREQSVFHKQKLIDQDPWVPYSVSRTDPKSMYENVIIDSNQAAGLEMMHLQ